MDRVIIEGGYKLKGEIIISGAKNAALPILFATLLTDRRCVLDNVPDLRDIDAAVSILKFFGKDVEKKGNRVMVSNRGIPVGSLTAPYDLIKKMRASFLSAGPMLSRYGRIKVSLPGGCAIGVRPVDIHLDGFERLGAKVSLEGGYIDITAKHLKGADIYLRYPSVGATENLILACALSHGVSCIHNAAREPEIDDLIRFLNALGADIERTGPKTIRIRGVKYLNGIDSYSIIPDRIETGTYLIAAAVTEGKLTLLKCNPEHLLTVTGALRKAGLGLKITPDSIDVRYTGRINPVDITTAPYPGFPTDLQAQWMVLMSKASGSSVIREKVFENRFLHVAELVRLGAKLIVNGRNVYVTGGGRLTGATVMVSDLRAGAALLLAGLRAKGGTTVTRVYHLDRGYENYVDKLSGAGAHIKRIKGDL
ncbi:MAG: UDP-N-acetylglucosamine 1-carboxyvinyltransferase [Elusimicrobiota bacterium]